MSGFCMGDSIIPLLPLYEGKVICVFQCNYEFSWMWCVESDSPHQGEWGHKVQGWAAYTVATGALATGFPKKINKWK